MQWVFDKRALFGEASSHLSLVSSGATALVGQTNQELVDLALRELTVALPAVKRARQLRRAVVVREKRATFSVAPGQPPRPPVETPLPGVFLAGDWIDTGLPATIEGAVVSGHRAAARGLRVVCETVDRRPKTSMNSIVVHYQELALKGKNRPWFLGRLVRNLRRALSDLDVRTVRALMGRIEVVLGPGAVAGRGQRAHPRMFGIANFSYAAAPLDYAGPISTAISTRREAILADLGDRTCTQLPRVGSPRRQALSADVAADRARGRRPHQGGARLDASNLDEPELDIHVELLTEPGVLLLRQGARARAACRRGRPAAWCACCRAASIRRSRRTA